MEATKEQRKHAPIVNQAKVFLQLGLGMTEPHAHRTLQYFATSGQVRLELAAEIVCRLERAAQMGSREEA